MKDLFDLTDRVAVVTGGSRGLGREMMLGFARAGADVVIASRKIESCQAPRAPGRGGDRAPRPRARLPRRALAGPGPSRRRSVPDFGKVDVLVNNAGMSPLYDQVVNVTEDLYDKVLAAGRGGRGDRRGGAVSRERRVELHDGNDPQGPRRGAVNVSDAFRAPSLVEKVGTY